MYFISPWHARREFQQAADRQESYRRSDNNKIVYTWTERYHNHNHNHSEHRGQRPATLFGIRSKASESVRLQISHHIDDMCMSMSGFSPVNTEVTKQAGTSTCTLVVPFSKSHTANQEAWICLEVIVRCCFLQRPRTPTCFPIARSLTPSRHPHCLYRAISSPSLPCPHLTLTPPLQLISSRLIYSSLPWNHQNHIPGSMSHISREIMDCTLATCSYQTDAPGLQMEEDNYSIQHQHDPDVPAVS